MLKNWTVTTQPVRLASDGVLMRERYLLNPKHANHKHSEALISLFGCAETSNRIAIAGEQFRLNQQLYNRRGGRPISSYAIEYCLTLPKGYRPSDTHWTSIVKDCCLTLAKLCKLNKSEFAQYRQQIRAVLHQQSQNGTKGSGDHVHLIIGKVVGNRVLKELQQKKATKLIKQAFNQSVLKHVGIDHRTYEPVEVEKGRRLSTWQYQHQKATDALEIEKTIKQMQVQFDKWLRAKAERDERQLKRQKNRLLKTYEELKAKNTSPTQTENINKIKNEII
ncbi:phage protein [Vibrio renipiscarius]|uniref:Phage protein n=1 Tax=Vibrio renipiscarius TaxID=1461322 RepID=A0A0C2JG09_9VIBR|nr:phage protein [Vibrio renipiscarius]KII76894.1 phage protein [Vibrio renipiscarius]KII77022.1 phage protein [Vibrio renipiscarius]